MIVVLAAVGFLILLAFAVVLSGHPLFRPFTQQLDEVIEGFRQLDEDRVVELMLLLDRGFNDHLSEKLSAEQAAWAWNTVQKERETRARIILEDMRANVGCCSELARIGLVERQSRSSEERARFEKAARDLVSAAALCQLRIAAIQCELSSGITLDTTDPDMAAMLQVVGARLVIEYHQLIQKAFALCALQGNRYRDALRDALGCPQHGSVLVMPQR